MSRHRRSTVLGVLRSLAVLMMAYLVLPTIGHAACSVNAASLHGWYGLLVSGQTTLAAPVTKIQAGALFFDGAGAVSGNHVYGSAGSLSAAQGKYAVNTDCTVTVVLTVGAAKSSYTVALKATGEAVGIETDAAAVATISLQPQYATLTPGLNFNSSSLNGAFAASCGGFLGAYSDVNLATYNNGAVSGTDPFNNDGNFSVANNPYTGTYAVNSDGTFVGGVTVDGASFDFYGVVTTSNSSIEYFYTNVANGAPTDAIGACVGKTALAPARPASQSIAFASIATQTVGAPLALQATASSGLAVTFASTTPSVCTVSGTTASFATPGTCAITASQSGNASFAAATPVTQQFAVNAASSLFTLHAQSSTLTVTPPTCIFVFCFGGLSASDLVTVTPAAGFSGKVSFAVAGLPSGVRATFAPPWVIRRGFTFLTLTPGAGTATHQSTTLTVTGTSGAASASATVTLNY